MTKNITLLRNNILSIWLSSKSFLSQISPTHVSCSKIVFIVWPLKMKEWWRVYEYIYLNCGKYELGRKKIITVIYTTFAVVKRKPEKKKIFSGFLFTTAKVVYITAMIFFLSNVWPLLTNILMTYWLIEWHTFTLFMHMNRQIDLSQKTVV